MLLVYDVFAGASPFYKQGRISGAGDDIKNRGVDTGGAGKNRLKTVGLIYFVEFVFRPVVAFCGEFTPAI